MSSACNSGLLPSKSVNTDGHPVSRDSVKLVQWRESGVLNSFVVAGGWRGGTAQRSVWGKVNEDHKALWKTKGYLTTKQSSDLFMSGQRGIKIKLEKLPCILQRWEESQCWRGMSEAILQCTFLASMTSSDSGNTMPSICTSLKQESHIQASLLNGGCKSQLLLLARGLTRLLIIRY